MHVLIIYMCVFHLQSIQFQQSLVIWRLKAQWLFLRGLVGLGKILKETPFGTTVGLDEAKIRKYIKNQQMNESIIDAYDSDLNKDPFKGAGIKEDNDK